MTTNRHSMADANTLMNELLDRARRRAWEGPDHSPRVEEHLRGTKMHAQSKHGPSRLILLLIGVGVVAGGSLAAAVTHTLLNRRATLVTSDGKRYDVELLGSPDGASGTFIADDGTVFGIEMVEEGDRSQVTVGVTSPNGGMSSVILDDGTQPRVLTKPGETATIKIETTDGERSDDDSER
jgi:hypothetical protein